MVNVTGKGGPGSLLTVNTKIKQRRVIYWQPQTKYGSRSLCKHSSTLGKGNSENQLKNGEYGAVFVGLKPQQH
jgi:hypothetical protein